MTALSLFVAMGGRGSTSSRPGYGRAVIEFGEALKGSAVRLQSAFNLRSGCHSPRLPPRGECVLIECQGFALRS
jgi:hypothetical protein